MTVDSTLDTYGHLGSAHDFLQREVDRLTFGDRAVRSTGACPVCFAGASDPYQGPREPRSLEAQGMKSLPQARVGATGFEPVRGHSGKTEVRRGLRPLSQVILGGS
jgi:hypothetical protein